MKKQPLTPETADAILDAAWTLMLAEGRADVGLGEVARAAGVTRQSVYLGFGSRAGLLLAMARRADAQSAHSRRMRALADTTPATAGTLIAFTEAWLDHLPEIFAVGTLLLAAAATDADARQVVRDRLDGSLRGAFRQILAGLPAGPDPDRAAALAWSLTHLDAWRHLVIECGWTPAEFRADRLTRIADLLRTPCTGTK